jgi:hypothetical protein
MEAVGTRFEVRVGTLLSQATLAALRLPLRRIDVPRHRLYRLYVAADHDVPAVISRLAEQNVQIVEIRQCPAPRRRDDAAAPARPVAPRPDPAPPPDPAGGVVLPFRRTARSAPGDRPAG